VWVNGERVPSTVVAPPRRPTPREADIGADPEDRRPGAAPEDFWFGRAELAVHYGAAVAAYEKTHGLAAPPLRPPPGQK